ncbi:hypothetical protein G6F63_016103 [Rhizopus arrhizus]|nr:hypothetical protein G6F63_016103 [Rhizopus arrhizus]
MRRVLLIVATHLLTLGLGFGLGVYLLPILIAPDDPPATQRCGALGRRQGQRQPHPGGLRRQDGAGAGLQGLPGARLRRQQGRLPEGQGAVPAQRRGEDLQPFPGRCT